ncbi:MAG: class I SAM-dependent methyltransferase [Rhodocyclaceae bacterium]|nr:MAG: class I SAM-dependent methyltransferase [Gammaproteobacteria bacterium]TXG77933.1 MAG: class I SAM-dependent methyltransferase [Rhodocyclaceae bacterium]
MEFQPVQIARHYLPHRTHYYYARSKFATDPLYRVVAEALTDTHRPLLDVGCGIGLLAHVLRGNGFSAAYSGVDIDSGKIRSATAAASRAGLKSTQFSEVDLSREFPQHRGSVALLDIVQFLEPSAQDALLESALACLDPGAVLIMRSGLARPGWRLRFTRFVDWLARMARWMNVGPKAYPVREELEQRFARHGVQARFESLSGRLPFENWLIIARRSEQAPNDRQDHAAAPPASNRPTIAVQGLPT